ncbi:SPFH domain-containing protein [Marinobacteraceae bacterium S3BR75-40.1]
MLGLKYFKADSNTFVIQTVNGRVKRQGKGLSFWYLPRTSSIAAVPVSAQESPFIFGLQTSDYQSVRVQGQLTFQAVDPGKTAEVLNFTLGQDGESFVSEDPMKLGDRVIRAAQTLSQQIIETSTLRQALNLSQTLVARIRQDLANSDSLSELGVALKEASITAITPSPETAKALEAETREEILKKADDAIYARRKAAVEQERTIQDAELDTEFAMQQKRQSMEEQTVLNQRKLLQEKATTEKERIEVDIEAARQKESLFALNAENNRIEAESQAYAISQKMAAYKEIPVESLRAMAMAKMDPNQLMAAAFEVFANNAEKIGELNIAPDMLREITRKGAS